MDGGSHTLERIGVCGGGFMGTGIAEAIACADFDVVVYEPWEKPRLAAKERVDRALTTAVSRGRLSEESAQAARRRVRWVAEVVQLADCDLVIEAVPEDIDLKVEVFGRLDRVVQPDALLATNTSSLSVGQLAAATDRPQNVLGLHFFAPVPMMKLVEIVAGMDTSPNTMARVDAFVRSLGKTPIQPKDRAGFVVNMLLVPYLMAAVRMFDEGFAAKEEIDDGMRLGCGYPMGPLTLCDMIGLDVLSAVADALYDEFRRPEYAPPPVLKRMIAANRLGRKTGRGFYSYANTA